MNEFKKFIELSRILGQRSDFVQGAGGNVSIKIDSQKMLIKASGWRLSDIDENSGLVEVNLNQKNNRNFIFKGTRNFLSTRDLPKGERPSIETGFHTFLDKFVIHTHSVYANIIACAVNGKLLWKEISKDFDFGAIWVGYSSPGENLALAVKKSANDYKNEHLKMPEVILMQNHGLIISGDNLDRVFELHNEIQEIIKARLNLGDNFPEIKISETSGGFKSQTRYLKDFIKNNYFLIENFSKNILFPDQAVFCNSIGGKILINEANGDIFYKTNYKEALAIEENLTAWAYIVGCAKDCGLASKFLSLKDVDYINNMESEKYRQQLLEK